MIRCGFYVNSFLIIAFGVCLSFLSLLSFGLKISSQTFIVLLHAWLLFLQPSTLHFLRSVKISFWMPKIAIWVRH
jgi:hypothetical protein